MTELLERRTGHATIPIPKGESPAMPIRKSKKPVHKRKGYVAGKKGGRGRSRTDTIVSKL
jgi:hypothetical protein